MAIKLKVSETSAKLKATSTDALQFGVEQGIPIYPDPYEGSYEVTPTEAEQTLETKDLMMTDDVTVEAIPSDYVGSEIERRDSTDLTASGPTVSAPSGYYEENASKTIPSGTVVPANAITAVGATLTASNNKLSLYRECLNAPYVSQAGYIESGTQGKTQITLTADVNTRSSSDLTASGNTVTAPSGYYGSSASKSVQSGSATTPTGGITANPSISVDSNGLITASVNKSESITPIINEGYVTSGTAGTITFSGSATQQMTKRTSSDLTQSGPTVTAPAGYYPSSASKTVPDAVFWTGIDDGFYNSGNTRMWKATAFTEIDTSQGDTAGYIGEGRWDGEEPIVCTAIAKNTSVTPTESSQTIGGANYMMEGAVTVNAIPSNYIGSGITQRSSSDLSANGATVTAPAGYYPNSANKTIPNAELEDEWISSEYYTDDGERFWSTSAHYEYSSGGYISAGTYHISGEDYNAVASGTTITPSTSSQTVGGANYMMEGPVTVSAMPSGTAGTPTATKGTVSNHSVSVTPSVTNSTGYITGSTKTGTAVTVSASELVSGSETKTANGTYDVTNLAQLVVNVSGGGSSNFTLLGTKSLGTISTSSTTDTDTGQTIVLTGWNDYDLLVCECSVNTKTNGRHAESTRLAWLTASSNVTTKDGCTFATATHNTKLSSSGTATTRSSTTAYGVYAKAGTISGTNLTITIYRRYNSTQTGTINGSYTMRVYGCKIYDLIGG